MNWRFVLNTGPTSEPLTTAVAKAHLRVDISDDDTLIDTMVTTIRTTLEQMYDICLITQTWDWYLDDWPAFPLTIPKWPLQSVSSIKYTDIDGNQSTYSSANYIVDTYSKPGRIVIKKSSTLPSDELLEANGIEIEFIAGHGDAAGNVPAPIRHAMLLMLGDLYENREDTLIVERARASAQKLNIAALLMANYRSWNT